MSAPKNIQTQLLHSDRTAGVQHAPSHQPIYKSVQFAYDSAQGIADAFQASQQATLMRAQTIRL